MNTNYLFKQNSKKIIFLIFIIPIILQLIIVNIIKVAQNEILYYSLFFLFGLLYLPYFFWLNIAVDFLYANSNKHLELKINSFKISLVLSILFFFNFIFFVAYIFSFILIKKGSPDIQIAVYLASIQIIGVAFFAYNNYFVCKLTRTIQLNRQVNFNEITSTLITFFFPPLAIWIIHNQVKKIYDKNTFNI